MADCGVAFAEQEASRFKVDEERLSEFVKGHVGVAAQG
jgi:hypothetical protein